MKCELCGKYGDNPHHIVGKKNYRLRYDLRNGCCLCSGCHTFRRNSAHQDPLGMYEYMVDYREEDWDYLITVRNHIKKWSAIEQEELLKKYDKIIKSEKWNSAVILKD